MQQAEEALHGRVVTGGPDTPHRADHLVSAEGVDEPAATELGEPLSVCRMQPATSPRRDTALLSAVTANRDFDVPLYWQCWKMDSPVQTITGEVLSAAMSLRLRKK